MSFDVTVLMCSYKHVHLVKTAVESLKRFYPDTLLIVVDDGSQDEATKYVAQLPHVYAATDVLILSDNLTHGPALAKAAALVDTPFFFTMDTDIEVIAGGFIERMLELANRNAAYLVGPVMLERANGRSYPHGSSALWRTSDYRALPPFVYHGCPAIFNLIEAEKRGLAMLDFDVTPYLIHKIAATRRASPTPGWWDANAERAMALRERHKHELVTGVEVRRLC